MSLTIPAGFSLRGLLVSALAAGAIAGAVSGALQQILLVPLIVEAEHFEIAASSEGFREWTPQPGFERIFFGVTFNCFGAVGFALLLTACYGLCGRVSWRQGLLWGLCGYACVSLAPALGLAPELPGAHAADLAARQLWWLFAAVSTGAGIACAAFGQGLIFKLLGIGIAALPHVVGAPKASPGIETVPDELALKFAGGSLAVSLVLWLLLGPLTALFLRRWGRIPAAGRAPSRRCLGPRT